METALATIIAVVTIRASIFFIVSISLVRSAGGSFPIAPVREPRGHGRAPVRRHIARREGVPHVILAQHVEARADARDVDFDRGQHLHANRVVVALGVPHPRCSVEE
jgi:hypothetical protein